MKHVSRKGTGSPSDRAITRQPEREERKRFARRAKYGPWHHRNMVRPPRELVGGFFSFAQDHLGYELVGTDILLLVGVKAAFGSSERSSNAEDSGIPHGVLLSPRDGSRNNRRDTRLMTIGIAPCIKPQLVICQ